MSKEHDSNDKLTSAANSSDLESHTTLEISQTQLTDAITPDRGLSTDEKIAHKPQLTNDEEFHRGVSPDTPIVSIGHLNQKQHAFKVTMSPNGSFIFELIPEAAQSLQLRPDDHAQPDAPGDFTRVHRKREIPLNNLDTCPEGYRRGPLGVLMPKKNPTEIPGHIELRPLKKKDEAKGATASWRAVLPMIGPANKKKRRKTKVVGKYPGMSYHQAWLEKDKWVLQFRQNKLQRTMRVESYIESSFKPELMKVQRQTANNTRLKDFEKFLFPKVYEFFGRSYRCCDFDDLDRLRGFREWCCMKLPSEGARDKIRHTFNPLLDQMVLEKVLAENRFRALKWQPGTESGKDEWFPQREIMRAIVAAQIPAPYNIMTMLSASCGLNPAEVFGLRICRINCTSEWITNSEGKLLPPYSLWIHESCIDRSYGPPKNNKRDRIIPVPIPICRRIGEWLASCRQPLSEADAPLFQDFGRRCKRPGQPLRDEQWHDAIESVREIINCEKATPKGFRKHCTTQMQDMNVPILDRKALLGHSAGMLDKYTDWSAALAGFERLRKVVEDIAADLGIS